MCTKALRLPYDRQPQNPKSVAVASHAESAGLPYLPTRLSDRPRVCSMTFAEPT